MSVWTTRSEMMVSRLAFIVTITVIILGTTFTAEAQQPGRVPKIGYLVAGSASSISTYVGGFRDGLRELGYVDGKNILIEFRYAEGNENRLPELANDLVRLNVDIIFVGNSNAARAAKRATGTIPIVIVVTADPVANGLVKSLARPGENVTGLTRLSNSPGLNAKRLELLKEALPSVRSVAVLRTLDSPSAPSVFNVIRATAHALGVHVESVEIREPKDLENGFSAIIRKRVDALMVVSSSIFNIHELQIVRFAADSRLPATYPRPEAVDSGGLMHYGPDDVDSFRRAATYVHKILKGANPADLPVEQPRKFQLVINLKTAKQIGVTIADSMLYRADKVLK